jgi:hypothetical protein
MQFVDTDINTNVNPDVQRLLDKRERIESLLNGNIITDVLEETKILTATEKTVLNEKNIQDCEMVVNYSIAKMHKNETLVNLAQGLADSFTYIGAICVTYKAGEASVFIFEIIKNFKINYSVVLKTLGVSALASTLFINVLFVYGYSIVSIKSDMYNYFIGDIAEDVKFQNSLKIVLDGEVFRDTINNVSFAKTVGRLGTCMLYLTKTFCPTKNLKEYVNEIMTKIKDKTDYVIQDTCDAIGKVPKTVSDFHNELVASSGYLNGLYKDDDDDQSSFSSSSSFSTNNLKDDNLDKESLLENLIVVDEKLSVSSISFSQETNEFPFSYESDDNRQQKTISSYDSDDDRQPKTNIRRKSILEAVRIEGDEDKQNEKEGGSKRKSKTSKKSSKRTKHAKKSTKRAKKSTKRAKKSNKRTKKH